MALEKCEKECDMVQILFWYKKLSLVLLHITNYIYGP